MTTALANFCPSCGTARLETGRFCGTCGGELPELVATAAPSEATPADPGEAAPAPGRRPDGRLVVSFDDPPDDAIVPDAPVQAAPLPRAVFIPAPTPAPSRALAPEPASVPAPPPIAPAPAVDVRATAPAPILALPAGGARWAAPAALGAVVALVAALLPLALLFGAAGDAGAAIPALGFALGASLVASADIADLPLLGTASGSATLHLPLTTLTVVPLVALALGGWAAADRARAASVRDALIAGAAVGPAFGVLAALANALGSDVHAEILGTLLWGTAWGTVAGGFGGMTRVLGRRAPAAVAERAQGRFGVPALDLAAAAGWALARAASALAGVIAVYLLLWFGAFAVDEQAMTPLVAALMLLAVGLVGEPLLRRAGPGSGAVAAVLLGVAALAVVLGLSSAEGRAALLGAILLLPTLIVLVLYFFQGVVYEVHYAGSASFFDSVDETAASYGATTDPRVLLGMLVGLPLLAVIVAALMEGGATAARRLGATSRGQAAAYGALVAVPWAIGLLVARGAATVSLEGDMLGFSGGLRLGPGALSTVVGPLLVGAGAGAAGAWWASRRAARGLQPRPPLAWVLRAATWIPRRTWRSVTALRPAVGLAVSRTTANTAQGPRR
ncbi:MAG TPA: zinc ribbon domain-containing protein [Solirubrobacteraceae bacterium]|jgi:hypothetical protein